MLSAASSMRPAARPSRLHIKSPSTTGIAISLIYAMTKITPHMSQIWETRTWRHRSSAPPDAVRFPWTVYHGTDRDMRLLECAARF